MDIDLKFIIIERSVGRFRSVGKIQFRLHDKTEEQNGRAEPEKDNGVARNGKAVPLRVMDVRL
jgi:hypothetical protein